MMDSFLFSSILQVSLVFPKNSNIYSSKMLADVIAGIEKNRIEQIFFEATISQELVLRKNGSVTSDSILEYMKGVALEWIQSHKESLETIQSYYKHCLGKTAKGHYYYMVSRKEYILCTVQSSTFPSSSRITKLCSVKATSDPHSISISLLRPVETFNNNTLLIHFDSTPEHFSVISHNWLELQHVIQELYLEHSSSNDFQCEALVQKLTRIFVQDGVLVPRYYNVYRKTPEDDIYWKYSPFYINNTTKSLRSLLLSICEHLQKEPSAYIFLKPVDSTQFPTYRRIISNPMDLQTIQRRIVGNYYRSYSAFHRDMLQIFWNGCTFNPCSDIWYQQCVVLKLCYMHIYEELKAQGMVTNLPDDQLYDDSIIGGKMMENQSISCYTSASSSSCRTLAQNRKKVASFIDHYFGDYCDSFPLLSYPIRCVKEDYNAMTDDEISLRKGEIVYVTNNEDDPMVEVMKLDLVELGLFPAKCLASISNDGKLLKRVCDGKEIKEVKIRKRGKLVEVDKLSQSTPENVIPIQTQYTNYDL